MAYWFGGSGNWSDASHWSNNSGNSPASLLGHAPTESDDAIFDANSHNDNYTVTIDAAATCKDFTMDKPTGTEKKVTWAGSSPLAISGSLTLTGGTAGITNSYIGIITFNATSGTKTIDWNSVISGSSIKFDGSGGTFQLSRDIEFKVPPSYGTYLTRTAGTFDANGKKITVNITNGVYFQGLGFTGASSFYDLTIVGYAAKDRVFQLTTNITVTHTLLLNGNSVINRILLSSNIIGTQRTIDITGTTGNSFSNVDFKDINMVTGGEDLDLSAITGLSGDCGGNSGITFTPSDTMTWKDGDGGNWSDVGNWTGTVAADRVPLPQDDVDLGIAWNASQTVVQNMPRAGRSISWAGATGSPTWTTSTAASIFGSLDLTDLGTLTASTQTYTFEGRGNYTLTNAGNTWAKIIVINNWEGTLSLGSDFLSSTGLRQYNGSGFDANDKNVTCEYFRHSTVTSGTLLMGSGTWTITGVGDGASAVFAPGGLTTFNAETSTIKFTASSNDSLTFAGGSKTYNKVWFARGTSTGNITISGSNTFAELKDDGTEAHSLIFTAGTTQTIGTFDVNGSAGKEVTITSSTTGVHYLVKSGGSDAVGNYLNIQHSVATPANRWFAVNSTNNQSVATAGSGWIFNLPLDASVGKFALTGVDIDIKKELNIFCKTGNYLLTGIDIVIKKTLSMICSLGEYTITGINAILFYGRVLTALVGEYTLTGIDIAIKKTLSMFLSTGNFLTKIVNLVIHGRGNWTWTDNTKHTTTWELKDKSK